MRRALRRAAPAALALLAACATPPRPDPPRPSPPPVTQPEPARPGPARAPGPETLPGWDQEDHRGALAAFVAGCRLRPELAAACAEGQGLIDRRASPSEARAFFERRFEVRPVAAAGDRPALLTAYFAPEYPARSRPTPEFDQPVLGPPPDLRREGSTVLQLTPDGTFPYPDRAAIEARRPLDEPLAWMRREDLFFMQIQGSGYLTLEDGRRVRAAYAADNGRPFVGIARPMAERGLLPANGTSGEAIRAWLAANRGERAAEITALNPRYIFFRVSPDDGGQPAGAAGIALTPRRSVAVDPAHWRYGEVAWIEADGGNLVGARASYRGLVMALDTGSAIRGPVRADLYLGRGEAAGDEAGAVRHPLRMWRLVPRD